MQRNSRGPGFWQVLSLAIVVAAVIVEIARRTGSLFPAIDTEFPLDLSATVVFCGLSVAAGGFVIAAVLAVLEAPPYQPLRHIALLLGYLGFLGALLATVVRYRFHWATLWSLWSPKSVPIGAGIAFLLYSVAVLDSICRDAKGRKLQFIRSGWFRYFIMLLTSVAAFVAGLQQTAFFNILVVAPQQFSAMWVSPMLAVNLFLSNVSGSMALIIFTLWRLARVSGNANLMGAFDQAVAALRVLLVLLVAVRMLDLTDAHQWYHLAQSHLGDYLFGLELIFFLTPALFLLSMRRVERRLAHDSAVMVIAGFLTNRLNTAITSREVMSDYVFVPALSDVLVAAAVVVLGTGAFVWALNHDKELTGQEPSNSEHTLAGERKAAYLRS